ncbi:MAG: DUF420 domain-containing protein [Planctomycetes bacterium]|nr:DUF420 domain-containing protein [Planctomycetota bacterium]
MSRGFLGNNASLMLDVVVCALVLVVPVLIYSIYVVKVRRNYTRHRNIQLGLGALLLATVAAFEIDMQLVHGGWQNIVNRPGEPPRLDADEMAAARGLLSVHLVFAVSTPVLWALTLLLAWRRFSSPPVPGLHSRWHKRLGWLSTIDIGITSITGLAFYYRTFMS